MTDTDADDPRGKGILRNYYVERLNDPEGKHKNCAYFTLDPIHDVFSRVALIAYAEAARVEYPVLADEMVAWVEQVDDNENELTPRLRAEILWGALPADIRAAIMDITVEEAEKRVADGVAAQRALEEQRDECPHTALRPVAKHDQTVMCIACGHYFDFAIGDTVMVDGHPDQPEDAPKIIAPLVGLLPGKDRPIVIEPAPGVRMAWEAKYVKKVG